MITIRNSLLFLFFTLTSVKARPLALASPRDGIVLFEYPAGDGEGKYNSDGGHAPAPIIREPEEKVEDTQANPPIFSRPGRERSGNPHKQHKTYGGEGYNKGRKGHLKTTVVHVTKTVEEGASSTPCSTTTIEEAPAEETTSTPCENSTTVDAVVGTSTVSEVVVEPSSTPCDTPSTTVAPIYVTISIPHTVTITMIVEPPAATSTPGESTTTMEPEGTELPTTTEVPSATTPSDTTSTTEEVSTTTSASPGTTTTTASSTTTTEEPGLPGEVTTGSFILLPQETETGTTTRPTTPITTDTTTTTPTDTPSSTVTDAPSDTVSAPSTTITSVPNQLTVTISFPVEPPAAITQGPKIEIPTSVISDGNLDLDKFEDFLATALTQTSAASTPTAKPLACIGCGDSITQPIADSAGRLVMGKMGNWMTGVMVVVGIVALW